MLNFLPLFLSPSLSFFLSLLFLFLSRVFVCRDEHSVMKYDGAYRKGNKKEKEKNRDDGKRDSRYDVSLETFAMNDARARFVVLLFGNPHLLEGGQGSQDGTTDPYGILPLGRSDDLDLDRRGCEGGDFLLHTIGDTGIHSSTTGKDGVSIEIFADIDVALHDRVVDSLMDATGFHTQEGRLEKSFRTTEPLVTNGDNLTIGQLVALLEGGAGGSGGHFLFEVQGDVAELLLDGGAGGSGGHFLFEVQGDVAELLLDVANDFSLGRGGEAVASLGEDLHEIVSKIATGQVQTEDGMRKSVTFVDGYGVGDTVTGVQDDTGGTTGSVQGKDGLDGDVHGRAVEGFEHDLRHLLAISFRVEGRFSKEDRVFFRSDTQFVVEGVMPDLLHVIPIGDNTVLDRVFQSQDTSFALGLVTHVAVFLTHTDHHSLMARSADDRGEDGARSVVSGETGLAHAGAIIYDEGCYFVITHFAAGLVS
ncbi:Uncharacterized protein DBV15_02949, partial [Temnothorax longispinosus]